MSILVTTKLPGSALEILRDVGEVEVAAAPLDAARRLLRDRQTEVAHELAGRGEAANVPDLADQGHRRQRVDAAQAAQAAERCGISEGAMTSHVTPHFAKARWST